MDAVAELANVPPGDQGSGPASQRESDVAELTATRARQRVPLRAYVSMFIGSKLALGFARVLLALAAVSVDGRLGLVAAAQAASLMVESWRGAAVARKRLGYPLAGDQRVRLALWYTVATGIGGTLLALGVTFGKMFAVVPVLGQWSLVALVADRVAARGAAAIVGAEAVFLAAMVLLRYLLLSLFNPRR